MWWRDENCFCRSPFSCLLAQNDIKKTRQVWDGAAIGSLQIKIKNVQSSDGNKIHLVRSKFYAISVEKFTQPSPIPALVATVPGRNLCKHRKLFPLTRRIKVFSLPLRERGGNLWHIIESASYNSISLTKFVRLLPSRGWNKNHQHIFRLIFSSRLLFAAIYANFATLALAPYSFNWNEITENNWKNRNLNRVLSCRVEIVE